MEKQIKEMCNVPDQILAILQKDIAEIKLALLGNEYNPTSGLVHRMGEVEKENIYLKAKIDRIYTTSMVAATAIAIVANFIMWLVDVYIAK